jgi:hypothetical protein
MILKDLKKINNEKIYFKDFHKIYLYIIFQIPTTYLKLKIKDISFKPDGGNEMEKDFQT